MNLRGPLPAALLVLLGCGTPATREVRPLADGLSESRRKKDDEIVALFNGRPVTWRAVAEHALESDFRAAVDRYVRSLIVQERRTALGIVNTPGDLRRRAEALVQASLKEPGKEAFLSRIDREGLSLEAYIERLAGSRALDEALALEKVVRTQAIRHGTLEVERVVFADPEDARKFSDSVSAKGFDASAEAFAGSGRATRLPPEILCLGSPSDPSPAEASLLRILGGMKPGEVTGVLAAPGDSRQVIRLRAMTPGRLLPPGEERERVLEGILRDPPSAAEIRGWLDAEFSRGTLEYADRPPRRSLPP